MLSLFWNGYLSKIPTGSHQNLVWAILSISVKVDSSINFLGLVIRAVCEAKAPPSDLPKRIILSSVKNCWQYV